jgi:6-phosphogluconolactonase
LIQCKNRHFRFHPKKPFIYCVEELSGTVYFYGYKNGQLSLSNTYQSYENQQEEYASSDIHISPDRKYLHVSNRQDENSISIFLNGHQSTFGKIPRSFVIDPAGKYLIPI